MSTPTKPVAMDVAANPQPMWMTILGWVFVALMTFGFGMSAIFKFLRAPEMLKELEKFGVPEKFIFGIGVVEVVCLILYLIPKTAVLGAVLLTGYLGGAIMTHLRINDNFVPPIVMGVLLWLGIFLREPKLRQIFPLR